MHPVIAYVVAAGLFAVGVYGVLVRRNAVLLLMSVELMLNSVNILLVTANTTVPAIGRTGADAAETPATGQVFALFVIVLAAAEIGVGLAVVLQLYRVRHTVAVDEVPLTEAVGERPDELVTAAEVPADGRSPLPVDSGTAA